MNTEAAQPQAPAIEEAHPRNSTVRHRTLPLILGTVTGYGTDPFTGNELVLVVWPGMGRPAGYKADEIAQEA
ncbi:hypothetical protein EES39_40265 [Streptomyces sp. ADI92-24]|uniref:hypothetical protein n=1 Tax=Streptomyces sp. ADI92-24 TaxID=1522756 RepID=UPI000F558C7D|nr:hypothetical protein [Streptomyces sp. ADI92-24]RPK29258.1 hypothetical protein EES39_40265 [Streptomyces sp. ADI92-24]